MRDGSPRFLIARMSAIGDTALTLPLLCALRSAYPKAFIAWVVERSASPVLEGHEFLDELVVLPRLWFKSPREILALRKKLRSLRIDTAFDPQGITKTALANWLSGAKCRIGLNGKHGREFSRWFNNELVTYRHNHIVDRSLELLSKVDLRTPHVEFKVPRHAKSEATVIHWLQNGQLPSKFAVINPGASWDSKLWVNERFAHVATHLATRHELPSVVVWAGEREHGWATEIAQRAPQHARVAPKTNLHELTAILRRATLFVGSDTGPLHIAGAVGTPCVGLYGATRLEDCGPYGPHHIALQVQYHDGTRRERRRADNSAMRLITVDQVTAACNRILARRATAVA